MTRPYVLTAAAEADLRGLIRHTRARWGEARLRRYVGSLEDGITRLASGEQPFRYELALPGAARSALRAPPHILSAARERAGNDRSDPARAHGPDGTVDGQIERC